MKSGESRLRPLVWLTLYLGATACSGSVGADNDRANGDGDGNSVGGEGGDTAPAGAPDRPPEVKKNEACNQGIDPGAAPIRRMNHFEYDNTIRDLLKDDTRPAREFPPLETGFGFDNNAAALSVNPVLAEKYIEAAEGIASRALAGPLDNLFSCDSAKLGEDACGKKFVTDFGERAFRRPLDAQETTDFQKLFADVKGRSNYREGIGAVLTAFLVSPRFLYRIEQGRDPQADGNVVALDGWEMASRLSYFLWGSMPDGSLFTLAREDGLKTRDQLATQVKRMLADPRAKAVVARFHEQWLHLDRLDGVVKDEKMFPDFAGVAPLMRQEASAFIENNVFGGDGTLASLYTKKETYLNAKLASFYGYKGVEGNAFTKFTGAPDERSGLVTLGGIMALHAKPNQTSPVHRGKFVRESLLCDELPLPPAGLVVSPPPLDPNLTTRQRFTQHQDDPSCSGCHTLMDPLGLGFEAYDAVGRFRRMENGKAVDSSGIIVDAAGESDGPSDVAFTGAADLGSKLAASAKAQQCVTRNWFRFAFGRDAVAAADKQTNDACSLSFLNQRFASKNFKILDLVSAITESDAFLYRRVSEVGGKQ